MAFETERGNYTTVNAAISAFTTPAFVLNSQAMPLIRTEVFPETTQTIQFSKNGYLVAETLSESAAYTYSANSEYTQGTPVDCTQKMVVVASKLTAAAERFTAGKGSAEEVGKEQGRAVSRAFDADLKALFTGVSNVVTASTILTKDNLLDAGYLIRSGLRGAFSGELVGMFDYKGITEIEKFLTDTQAVAFTNKELLQLVQGAGKPLSPNGYRGDFCGISLYETADLPLATTDDVGCVWDRNIAFGAGVDTIGGVNSTVKEIGADTNFSKIISTWTFFKVVEINDLAACQVRSDT